MSDHLATFNLFREQDGALYITIVEARGVQEELGLAAGELPLYVMALKALFEAVDQTKARQLAITPSKAPTKDKEE